MQIYKVGGCVRDYLLGLAPNDTDYVVVDSNRHEMLAAGFKQVGADFPVFLHPDTGDEYALARSERSTGTSYVDFSFETNNVPLDLDLQRRDLTINSMAMDSDDNIIDPFGGQLDLAKQVLRHTSEAFKEDPVRVLRLARLRARFGPTWRIHPTTKLLINGMLFQLATLQPDRVYAEVSKAMSQPNSHIFFKTLDELQVLDAIFPSIAKLKSYREGSVWHQEPNVFEHTMEMLRLADNESSTIKFMILYHDIAKPLCRELYGSGHGHDSAELAEPLIDIKLPKKILHYVLFHIENHQRIFLLLEMTPKKVVKLIKSFRKDYNLLDAVLSVSQYDKLGSIRIAESPHTSFTNFLLAFDAINSYSPLSWINSQESQPNAEAIKQHVHQHSISIVKELL